MFRIGLNRTTTHRMQQFLSVLLTCLLAFTVVGGPLAKNTDASPPRVISHSPKAGALNVAVGRNVTATFHEQVRNVNGSTFKLRNTSTGTLIPATVSYNRTTRTATLNPSANLARGTKYTAVLTSGIVNEDNEQLLLQRWSFTTAQ